MYTLLLSLVVGAVSAVPTPVGLQTDLSILLHNDLYGNKTARNAAAIVLHSSLSRSAASEACASLGERLLDIPKGGQVDHLRYLSYKSDINQTYWIGGATTGNSTCSAVLPSGNTVSLSCAEKRPVLCSQSATVSSNKTADTSEKWRIAVKSGDGTFTGYRDKVSFRFLGIKYASYPQRFTYPQMIEPKGSMDALTIPPQCMQADDSPTQGINREDCLYLNIWTPYLPGTPGNSSSGPKKLKPVMFWIHGGGFNSGSGSDANFDGGNQASRGDVVSVAINYRLGTFGFLALNDGKTNGNYGLADMVTALSWVQKYISDFGGDPSRVTIYGQSAGGGAVEALLSSPEAKGKFHAAIMMSNPTRGLSAWASIPEYANTTISPILNATGCTGANALTCLQTYDAYKLTNLPQQTRGPINDGKYLVHSRSIFNQTGYVNAVPLMVGMTRDENGAFGDIPNTTNLTEAISLAKPRPGPGIPLNATVIVNSGLYPLGNTTNATVNMYYALTRVSTDSNFRCGLHAMAVTAARHKAYPKVYAYQTDRTYQIAWNPNYPVCDPPATPSHPYGDPSLQYLKCHSGDLYFPWGVVERMGRPDRDGYDTPFSQLILDMWTSFGRTFDPNPDPKFLELRGYTNTSSQLAKSGPWIEVNPDAPTERKLDWPTRQTPFDALDRCKFLGLTLDQFEPKK